MKILDDIKTQFGQMKTQIPMQKIQDTFTMARGKVPKLQKTYAGVPEARSIIERINFFLSEHTIKNQGKQRIFSRTVQKEDGSSTNYDYIVDFNDEAQVKRLRDVRMELIDLCEDDAKDAKKDTIPGYLDYIAMASA